MVLFNYSTKEITAKIVYYGPGLCGKTTNLQFVYENLPGTINKGKMLSLATKTDRTLFFDFLPIDLGTIRGMRTRLQLYTVPGQVFYNTTRKLVLKGADGIVFVADSQKRMLAANLESFKNLQENLAEHDMQMAGLPLILQFNKRDLPDVATIEELNASLNKFNAPIYEAVATTGIGVHETLKAITRLVLNSLKERYAEKREQRVEAVASASAASAKPAMATPRAPAMAAQAPPEPAPPMKSAAVNQPQMMGSPATSDDLFDIGTFGEPEMASTAAPSAAPAQIAQPQPFEEHSFEDPVADAEPPLEILPDEDPFLEEVSDEILDLATDDAGDAGDQTLTDLEPPPNLTEPERAIPVGATAPVKANVPDMFLEVEMAGDSDEELPSVLDEDDSSIADIPVAGGILDDSHDEPFAAVDEERHADLLDAFPANDTGSAPFTGEEPSLLNAGEASLVIPLARESGSDDATRLVASVAPVTVNAQEIMLPVSLGIGGKNISFTLKVSLDLTSLERSERGPGGNGGGSPR